MSTRIKDLTTTLATTPASDDYLVSDGATNGTRKVLWATLASSFGFRNRVINGDMRIDQPNAGAAVTVTGTSKAIDCWEAVASVTSKYSYQQVSSSAPTGFVYSLKMLSASAYTVGAGEVFTMRATLEGQTIADLAWGTASAKTVTLSFWVRSSLTGTHGGSIKNGSSAYSYPFTYTISAADTWEYKTVTITGPTSGTWDATTGVGCYISFNLGTGTTTSGTAGSWSATNYNSATGAVSVVGTNAATFYISGVQLEAGAAATPFELRDSASELARCQRYFEKSAQPTRAVLLASESSCVMIAPNASIANGAYIAIPSFKVTKRITNPSVTVYPYTTPTNTSRISNDTGTDYAAGSGTVSFSSANCFGISNQSGGALTIGGQQQVICGWYADARL